MLDASGLFSSKCRHVDREEKRIVLRRLPSKMMTVVLTSRKILNVSRGGYRNFLRGGGTVNKSYKKVGVDPKRGWVREGDMPPPARSAEAFDTI